MSERVKAGPGRASSATVGRAIACTLTVVLVSLAAAQGPAAPTLASPLTLGEAVAFALVGPDVRVAELQLEQAARAAEAAGAVLIGTARTGYQLAWRDGEPSDSGGPQALSVSATLNVVPYGPSADARARAEAALAAAQRALGEIRAGAAITAAERWWTADRAVAEEHLATERLDLAERGLSAVRVQVAAGTASASAEREALIALEQASLDALSARAETLAAHASLGQTLGRPVEALAPRGEDLEREVDAFLAAYEPPDAAVLRAAAADGERVRGAEQALADAESADARARRDAGASVSLSASYQASGDGGRVSLGAAWDSRSYQPSVDLSLDPFNAGPTSQTVSLGVTVSVPLNSGRGAEAAQQRAAVVLAAERLAQARTLADLELDAAARSVDAAVRQLAIALERATLRHDQQVSLSLRAELGDVSPLELDRARLDVAEAELALVRGLDQARASLARLELSLHRDPLPALALPFGIDAIPAMEVP